MVYDLLLLDYKSVQHVTILNIIGNCIRIASICVFKHIEREKAQYKTKNTIPVQGTLTTHGARRTGSGSG